VAALLGLIVVLVEPLYEANVGYVARAMKNFGIKDLLVVNPMVDLGNESRIFASHAKDVIDNAKITTSLEDAIRDMDLVIGTTAQHGKSSRNVLRSTSDPATFAERTILSRRKTAIVFGRDTTGLSNEELRLCDLVLTIPTNPEYPTLNISHAATIVFYELFKVQRTKKNLRRTGSDREALDRLIRLFNGLTTHSDLPVYKQKLAKRAFHNVAYRSFMTQRETSLLMGVFRKNLRLIDHYWKRRQLTKESASLYITT